MQWLIWCKNPAGYHIVNVLLHALNAVWVWRVLARLRIPGAWIAGMIFAAHPVCVASVAWISELKNTLSLGFFLVSFWCYLRFEENQVGAPALPFGGGEPVCLASSQAWAAASPSPPLRRGEGKVSDSACISNAHWWYWLSLAAFLLALLSKTSTVMLPVVLLACAWWQRGRITRQVWLRTIPFFGLALLFGLMTVWFQAHHVMHCETVQTENFWGRLGGRGAGPVVLSQHRISAPESQHDLSPLDH